MKVSARNVFQGKVTRLQAGAVNAEVEMELPSGERLVAVITMESAQNLGIAVDKEVIALVKAPWVMLMTDDRGIRLSARNCLSGTVSSVSAASTGAVNAEIGLRLPSGLEIRAVVTREAAAELGLKPGVAATAVIKASNVILGVAV